MQLDYIDADHRATSPATLERAVQPGVAGIKRATHHRDPVTARQQCLREFERADRGRALAGREILVKIQHPHQTARQ